MPIPTRSHSLRQPGFSQTRLNAVRHLDPAFSLGFLGTKLRQVTPDNEVDTPETRDKMLEQHRPLQNHPNRDINNPAGNAHSAFLGPPSSLSRAASLRKPSRQGIVAPGGTTSPPRNASSVNLPRTQIVDGRSSQPRPIPNRQPPVMRKPQHPGHQEVAQSSTIQNLAKSRVSLHSRSQSMSGPKTLRGQRQDSTAAVLVSSHATLPLPLAQASCIRHDNSKTAQVTAGKPQFSTYQQHFSPKRISKTPAPPIQDRRIDQQHDLHTVSAGLTTSPGPGDETPALQSQVSRLQDELLQLQLIHDSSHAQQNLYFENTMRNLKARFTTLSRDHRALAAQEYAYFQESNCAALQHWLSEGQLSGPEKVQTLARCIQEVATLAAPDGKHCAAIEHFETWLERTMLILGSRSSATPPLGQLDIHVSPLQERWHDHVATLRRKLDRCADDLRDLGSAREGSSVAMVLNTHGRFIDNLRQELEFSSAIEKAILQLEESWLDDCVTSIMQEGDPVALAGQQDGHRRGTWDVDIT